MSERYTRLFELETNLYIEGAPLIIEAGALLKDNKNNNILVQLKILNIYPVAITAVKVKITGTDAFSNPSGNTIFQYLDLNVPRNNEFGQQTPIILSNNTTRSFSITITEVVFANNTCWENTNDKWKSLASLSAISTKFNENCVEQYNIENGSGCVFVPAEAYDLWFCTCGCCNHIDENSCNSCMRDKNLQFSTLDAKTLEIEHTKRSYTEAEQLFAKGELAAYQKAAELYQRLDGFSDSNEKSILCQQHIDELNAARQRAAEGARRKNKRIAAIALIMLLVIASVFGYQSVIAPMNSYKQVLRLIENEQFTEAIAIGGELDSQFYEAAYKQAIEFTEKNQLAEAITIFSTLGNYKDSKDLCKAAEKELTYTNAVSLFEAENFDEAKAEFIKYSDYKDAYEYIKYIEALDYFEKRIANNMTKSLYDQVKLSHLTPFETQKESSLMPAYYALPN